MTVHWQYFSLLEVSLFTSLVFYMFKVKWIFYKRSKTRFLVRTCMYMLSTSYFKMLKHVSLYTKQFPFVRCGQIALLLMLKAHSFNSSERQQFTLQWDSLGYFVYLVIWSFHRYMYVYLISVLLSYMFIVSTYVN